MFVDALLGELASFLKARHADAKAEGPRSLLFEVRRKRTTLAGRFPESYGPLSALDLMSACGECGRSPLSERLEP